jgi:hypothetical protein
VECCRKEREAGKAGWVMRDGWGIDDKYRIMGAIVDRCRLLVPIDDDPCSVWPMQRWHACEFKIVGLPLVSHMFDSFEHNF